MQATAPLTDYTASVAKSWFNAKEVAEALDVSTRTIRRHIQEEELPAAKVGRQFVITRQDLSEYLGGMDRVDAVFGPEKEAEDTK